MSRTRRAGQARGKTARRVLPLTRTHSTIERMPLLAVLTTPFATQARQALGWAALGMVGMAAAGGGVVLLSDGGSTPAAPTQFVAGENAAAPSTTPTAAPSATPTRQPSPSPTATASATATATASGGTAPFALDQADDEAAPAETAEATAEAPQPTPAPATGETPYVPGVDGPHVHVPGTEYCVRSSSGVPTPPNTVFGLLEVGGEQVPAGTVVTMTFDGVPGPSEAITESGGYRIDWNAGGQGCANQVGSAMALVVDGVSYPVGTVGGNMIMRVDIIVP